MTVNVPTLMAPASPLLEWGNISSVLVVALMSQPPAYRCWMGGVGGGERVDEMCRNVPENFEGTH
jgi:hypothetical protein